MKNFLLILSIIVVFGLAVNDFFDILNDLDRLSKTKIKHQIIDTVHIKL